VEVVTRLHARTTDLVITGALVALLAAVSISNVFTYPPVGGFDAREHIEYARDVADGRLPDSGGASYTPPGFYALAALALELGEALGLAEPERLVQVLSALCLIASGALLVALARLLLPGRPLARWGALAFFVCSPVVLKSGAMFHPQPLAMVLSLLALTTTAWMIVRRDYRFRTWAALAVSLAAAQLVRSVSIWVVGVALASLAAAAAAQPEHRRRIAATLAVFAATVVLLPLPWYLHLQAKAGNPVLGRGITFLSIHSDRSARFFVDPGLPDVLTHPQRADLGAAVVPLLYAETWGDYFGIWSWGPPRPELSPAVNRRLALQSFVGLPLTALAVAGWLALVLLWLTRLRQRTELIVAALAPPLALAAVFYYVTRSYRPDGDTIKALFLLPAVPFWALSFGLAADVLVAHRRRLGYAVVAGAALCLLISLAFGTYAVVT
jgi:hypothetical protein